MLISDVFGLNQVNIQPPSMLSEKIREAFDALGLTENQVQTQKCFELHAQLSKRMGVALFGPPDSGKSTIISLLKTAIIECGKPVRSYIISPKAMNRSKLLGKMDPDTRIWMDGLLVTAVLAANAEPNGGFNDHDP